MAPLAFVEPEDAFCPKHLCRQLIVQKILEFAQSERAIAFEGQGGEPIHLKVV